jgi:hypothetical protein
MFTVRRLNAVISFYQLAPLLEWGKWKVLLLNTMIGANAFKLLLTKTFVDESTK